MSLDFKQLLDVDISSELVLLLIEVDFPVSLHKFIKQTVQVRMGIDLVQILASR